VGAEANDKSYKGDEFAVILPNTQISDATLVAEPMLAAVSSRPARIPCGYSSAASSSRAAASLLANISHP